jgi:hypothetical protein
MRRAFVSLALTLAACSPTAGTTSSTPAPFDVSCEIPPPAELDGESGLVMSVDPSPAEPRETVFLTVSSAGLPEDALGGVDARWQCWDGEGWVTTHAVYRGFGDNPGQTIQLNTEFQIRVPSIGLELDESFPIVIPQVEPGVYRIQDEVIVNDAPTSGFVIVEVSSGPEGARQWPGGSTG